MNIAGMLHRCAQARHSPSLRRFALTVDEQWRTIACVSVCSPRFGEIGVSDNSNTNTRSGTSLGYVCTNDAGLKRNKVLTGSQLFQVKEIEVFEIAE
jgi:hypothetical protein